MNTQHEKSMYYANAFIQYIFQNRSQRTEAPVLWITRRALRNHALLLRQSEFYL